MDKENIKTKFQFLSQAIDKCKDTFVLSKKLREYRKQLRELQASCPHEFNNGFCELCGKEESK
jgi:hypothetical protein